tara:strand:+ start:338 stop:553 length:216 start_codon:yes stop_codon:yes gene_type:complete
MKPKLTFLLSLTFLFLFGYKGECNSKSNQLDNNHFENFDVEGLDKKYEPIDFNILDIACDVSASLCRQKIL